VENDHRREIHSVSVTMNFYQLSSKSSNPETPDKTWFAEAQSSILCKGCSSARSVVKPVDVVLQTKPDKSALNFVHGVHIHIASVQLLETLFPDGPSEVLRLGKVLGPRREEASEHRTIMASNHILVRGDERSSFRVCPDCGRVWYSAIGKRYILKRNLLKGDVFETQSGNLIVTEQIANRVADKSWRNLVVNKLEVRDAPVDGLDVPD